MSMIGLTTGGILNILLDPLFINTYKMGISGAAVATLISQAISFLILLGMFVTKKSIITLSPKYITKDKKKVKAKTKTTLEYTQKIKLDKENRENRFPYFFIS